MILKNVLSIPLFSFTKIARETKLFENISQPEIIFEEIINMLSLNSINQCIILNASSIKNA